jgi:putative NADH-flavin reductase
MGAYAVLGATGNCGIALIKILLQSSQNKIHAYCRNKVKLLNLIPEAASNEQVEIFDGNFEDISLMVATITGCHAVFLCISTNDNIPGCRLAQDSAVAVIDALKQLKAESLAQFEVPKLVLLSSATLDYQLSLNTPPLVRAILLRSASQVYEDLRVAEKFLREQESWVKTIFIKPGGLSLDVQKGHVLSFTEEKSPLSYLDLAAAMIEAVDDREGKYDMKNVGVTYLKEQAKFPRGAPMCISMGLVRHYLPFLHPYLPATGPG